MSQCAADIGWNLENSYAHLPKTLYARVKPEPVPSPELVILNHRLATSLGLNGEALQRDEGVAILAGNQMPDGAVPLAQAYAGHQFGHFTMLGDGRAVLLGEQLTPDGERFDMQLKGSGKTPYSRRGDGRAALGPMLREYIISEAMQALGIPTTRSLAVVTTGASIIRESVLPGAILTRVAASHLRVGTFQYVSRWGTVEELRELANYTRQRHFPHLEQESDDYLPLLQEVVERQAALVAKWQLVGFIHGVMNTDNVALSGETIDYGPCAFMDVYDPATVFSSIDDFGRYAYGNQPKIAQWNLARFAETLLPLLHPSQDRGVEIAQEAIAGFADLYQSHWLNGMRAKLGLSTHEADDESLAKDLLTTMHNHRADYTNTFRALTLDLPEESGMSELPEFMEWHDRWQSRIRKEPDEGSRSQELMRSSNPAVIPRNHRVEEALDAAVEEGDYGVMERLLDALANPFTYSPEQDEYAKPSEPSPIPYRTFCGT